MKYKVGDEVLVKAKIISGTRMYFGVDIDGNRFDICEENIVPVPSMTAEEAWEIAKRICTSDYDGCENALLNSDLDEIFGTVDCGKIMNRYTPHQARDKIEAWESVNGIKVGDEVVLKSDPDNDEYRFFVTYINSKTKKMGGFSFHRESVFCERNAERYQKTGRHIDIEGLLKQIGGTVEERNNNN